jgi:hypothetical protein
MATINGLKLELVAHDHKNKTATIKVTYKAYLSSVERNMTGLRYMERIELWGADSPDPDDRLYSFVSQSFPVESDGVVDRSRQVTVGSDVLDEDGWIRPTDEVYAKVWINPVLPSGDFGTSNTIEHKF